MISLMARSSRGLGYLVFIQEITGSNPVRATNTKRPFNCVIVNNIATVVYGTHECYNTCSMKKLTKKSHESPGFLTDLIKKFRLAWFLIKDNTVPFTTKLIPFIILLYVVSPVDILPDLLPILGQIDDLALIIMGLDIFINNSPRSVVQYYKDILDLK